MHRALFKPHHLQTRNFVARVRKLNDHLKNFPLFGNNQELPEDKILEIIKFSLLQEWQKTMLVQGFDSATASVQDLIDLCERLECVEEIYSGGANPSNKKQKTGQRDQSASSAQKSGANQPAGGAEAPRKKQKICPLHGPGHSMEECKVMQAQAKG